MHRRQQKNHKRVTYTWIALFSRMVFRSSDALQIDILLVLPPSGGYTNIITAIDVFSTYLFAYTVMDASATSTAKVLFDLMTRHT